MKNFDFHNPTKLIFGKNTITRIGDEIARQGFRKVLFIGGGGSIRQNGVYDRVARSLRRRKIRWTEAWGVRPNPVLSKVYEMIRLARQSRAQAILAVGGGSVIDSAKAVAAGVCYKKDIWRAFETKESLEKALPLFTVLTLSATGTEMNGFAVVTHEKKKKKWNISGPALYPRVSIVDPSAQKNLPWKQTLNGVLDATAHILEFYFMRDGSDVTLALDEALLRSLMDAADRLKKNPGDEEARAGLAWAATLALNGTSGAGQGSGDWATHGMEHCVSALRPEVSHGAGLGVIFPAWIEYNQNANPRVFKRWARNIWRKNSVGAALRAMRKKLRSWGAPVSLAALGIRESQLEEIARGTLAYRMNGNLRKLSKRDVVKLLRMAKPAGS